MIEIIENVLCFLIAASIVIQLAPDESYKKCMKFFLGLVFLIVIIGSVSDEADKLMSSDIFGNIPDMSESDTEYYESIFNDYYGNVGDEEDR